MTVDMTPERWKRTEELYYAARDRAPNERSGFLRAACGDDDALRLEVESLLSEPDPDDGFLSKPALLLPADLADDLRPMIGRDLGGYRLESLLGAGGMGEVYRARDVKLGREVAIKILPREFTSHTERLARFEREARILASLNHPNVCAIYGVEEAEGIRLLILELVEGETLAEKLRKLSAVQSPGNWRRALAGSERAGVRSAEGRRRRRVRAPRSIAGRQPRRGRRSAPRETAPRHHVGGRHQLTDLGASIEIEGVAGQGTADWSPDGTWIVIGGKDARGPVCSRSGRRR